MPSATTDIRQQFAGIFGAGGRIHVIRAPGRVNLIGEHTDYNDGFVFPMAIEPEVKHRLPDPQRWNRASSPPPFSQRVRRILPAEKDRSRQARPGATTPRRGRRAYRRRYPPGRDGRADLTTPCRWAAGCPAAPPSRSAPAGPCCLLCDLTMDVGSPGADLPEGRARIRPRAGAESWTRRSSPAAKPATRCCWIAAIFPSNLCPSIPTSCASSSSTAW